MEKRSPAANNISPVRSSSQSSSNQSQIKRNLCKSFGETTDYDANDSGLIDDISSSPMFPYSNFYGKGLDDTSTSGGSGEIKIKFSPKDYEVAGCSSSSNKVATGVRNALISENSNLSPLLLSQTDYGKRI